MPATDFDGNPRIIGGHIDIGAYEFDPNAPTRVTFNADQFSGAAPFSVQFTSLTTSYVSSYSWDFGDGTSSTDPNPAHSFGPGTYTVSLSVSGPAGTGTVTKENLIESYITYTITASAGAGGTITPVGAITAKEGSSVSFTALPNPGYKLTSLTIDGVDSGNQPINGAAHSFSNIQSDHTITAVFALLEVFQVTASAGPGGTITSPGITTVKEGSSLSYTVTPTTDYCLITLTVDGAPVAGNPLTYSFTGIELDHAITAVFALCPNYTSVTVSAGDGGTISPAGPGVAMDGGSLTYTAAPNPGYLLTAILVDGATVGGPSIYPVTYTFSDIQPGHTLAATFAPYLDYFGIQAGNHLESQVTSNGSTQTQTDDISMDTTTFPQQPCLLDLGVAGANQIESWFQDLPQGIFMLQQKENGQTLTYAPAMPMFETPLAAGAHWTANSTVTDSAYPGIPLKGKITAKLLRIELVNVPAGYFMAWPITYKLTVSAGGRTQSTAITNWFAPYIGSIKTIDSNTTTVLTKFAVGGGTVTTPPPIVTGTVPSSGTPGSTITINGYQFGASQGNSVVKIGSVDCEIVSWSDQQIQCTVPDAASSGAVTVITDTWTSNGTVHFMILPQITNVVPSSGKRGSSVVITGTNFGTIKGKVKFGNAQAKITQWGDTSIICTVPAAPYGTCAVKVLDSVGQSVFPGAFTVVR
ncbi:MAG: IPT/TIG domain-containing protein [Syntrophobacteraceae bacterium]